MESVTPEGLKDVYKGFNLSGEALVERLRTFEQHGVYVLGSFIFGLPSDRPETFEATEALAERAGITFAQFVMLTPFPGTVDFERWERDTVAEGTAIDGVPITRHWLIPQEHRPKDLYAHPVMSPDEIRQRTQAVWDSFYAFRNIWARAQCVKSLKARLAFVLISKLYRQMYANTGIATDSARVARSARMARWIAKPCRRLFAAAPMPELQVPDRPEAGTRAWNGTRTHVPCLRVSLAGVLLAGTAVFAGAPARGPARAMAPPVATAEVGTVPGSALPVVKTSHYRMAGRVRPLLFWIGRDDVGSARITWRGAAEGPQAYELLVGTDPAKAPRRINRWGYIAEEVLGRDGALLALMSRSDEDSYEDAQSNVSGSGAGGDFRAIRGRVVNGSATHRVARVRTEGAPTIHDIEALLGPVQAEISNASTRETLVGRETRPGFLVAVAELVDHTLIASRAGTGRAMLDRVVPYVFGRNLYELRVRSFDVASSSRAATASTARVGTADFEILNLATRVRTRFEMTYPLTGDLAGVPLTIEWQPRWWLKVELHRLAAGG